MQKMSSKFCSHNYKYFYALHRDLWPLRLTEDFGENLVPLARIEPGSKWLSSRKLCLRQLSYLGCPITNFQLSFCIVTAILQGHFKLLKQNMKLINFQTPLKKACHCMKGEYISDPMNSCWNAKRDLLVAKTSPTLTCKRPTKCWTHAKNVPTQFP